MSAKEEIIIECKQCIGHCGALVTVDNGKAVKIRGDKNHPASKGTMCKRGLASLEFIYHPDRLKKPLKRTGERGEGKWAEISWDEAFGIAGSAFNRIKEQYGPLSVLMAHGSAKGPIDTYLVRLANAFGTPNVVCSDHDCHVPKILASEYTFGYFPMPMIFDRPACIISWGAARTEQIPFMRNDLVRMIGKGTKFIVIDPMPTRLTGKESMWLRIKPGTDLPLALGMLNVIIGEDLYDHGFVEKWTTGFDRVKKHVDPYTPGKVEAMTWVRLTRLLKRPGCTRLQSRTHRLGQCGRPDYKQLSNITRYFHTNGYYREPGGPRGRAGSAGLLLQGQQRPSLKHNTWQVVS